MIVYVQNKLINVVLRVLLIIGEIIVWLTPSSTDNAIWKFIKKLIKAYLRR